MVDAHLSDRDTGVELKSVASAPPQDVRDAQPLTGRDGGDEHTPDARAAPGVLSRLRSPMEYRDWFVKEVKAHPGKYTYGSSGVGSIHHLTTESMNKALGLDLLHVPFKGTAQSVPAVVSNQVTAVFSAIPSLAGSALPRRWPAEASATSGRCRSRCTRDWPPAMASPPPVWARSSAGPTHMRTPRPARSRAAARSRAHGWPLTTSTRPRPFPATPSHRATDGAVNP